MSRHMRTTIRLQDALLQQAKQHAAATGRTLTALVEDSLREALAKAQLSRPTRRRRLRTSRGAFVRGLDLDCGAALRDDMDGVDAAV